MWSIMRQHMGDITRVSANYLSPFSINFYKGMRLLTDAEQKKFQLQTHAEDGDETLDANDVDTDQEETQLALPLEMADGPMDQVEERPQKRRDWAEMEADAAGTEKEGPLERGIRPSDWRPSAAVESGAPKEAKGKKVDKDEGTQGQKLGPSAEAVVVPLLPYLDSKLEKYDGPSNVGSNMELLRTRTRVKVAATTLTVEQVESWIAKRAAAKALLEEKKKKLHELKAKYEIETQKWLQLRDLKRRVTTMIACSGGLFTRHASYWELHASTSARHSGNQSLFFINFYKGMGLLNVAEHKKFPLETKTTDDEEALGGNEVASYEDDLALALTLANVNKLKDVIKELPAKDTQEEGEEQGGDTEVETSNEGCWPPRQPPVYTPLTKEYSQVLAELVDMVVDPNMVEKRIDCVVEDVEKTIAEQQPMLLG
ncbi:hypothetical protein AXG93_3632s1000 [Marchantia polymorpha subsp. ruderalis]|uniref:Uncharacterized protein n=1 Tax=Marchantia polymorpha subsp. ruderalis TaxID=1480154 RepID=A0A176VDD2_MARPO|nr:hypothetical protein AXG93_3632s1000 [Marchantia polymorpha subsp. ruderalis]